MTYRSPGHSRALLPRTPSQLTWLTGARFRCRLDGIPACYMTLLCTQCINGVHQVRVTGKRLEGRRVILRQEGTHVDLLHIKINKLQPSEVILQVTPDPLNRVQLWAVGWQPHAPHVLGPPQALGGVGATVIQEQDV